MRPIPIALTVAALALALAPASAQSLAEKIDDARNIPPEEWRAMATGRTLTYRIDGDFWAMERYQPGSNRVMLQFVDGECIEGTWDYRAPLYCFHWEELGTSCFRHARFRNEILIIETFMGEDTGAVQMMTDVTDTPLACGPAVIS